MVLSGTKAILAILFFVGGWANASALRGEISYYPADFYSAVDSGLRNQQLKDQLFAILSKGHVTGGDHDKLVDKCTEGDSKCVQHASLGYQRAREVMFGEIHLRKGSNGYEVPDVYCREVITEKDCPKRPPGPNRIPDSNLMNAEHTWPQSYFSKAFNEDLQKSDLNILYPVKSLANSSRSNLHFSNVTSISTQPCAPSKRGLNKDGNSNEVFEPPSEHKGNVARAIFYFAVRYKMAVPKGEEDTLRQWHQQDPPDEAERKRNDIVLARQGDRNPFIDHPELVDLISEF